MTLIREPSGWAHGDPDAKLCGICGGLKDRVHHYRRVSEDHPCSVLVCPGCDLLRHRL